MTSSPSPERMAIIRIYERVFRSALHTSFGFANPGELQSILGIGEMRRHDTAIAGDVEHECSGLGHN